MDTHALDAPALASASEDPSAPSKLVTINDHWYKVHLILYYKPHIATLQWFY